MDRAITIMDMGQDYLDLVDIIMDQGNYVAPRGETTWEIEDATIRLPNPRYAAVTGIGRGYSHAILAAETLQWIAGMSDLRQLDSVSKGRFTNYANEGIDEAKLFGAYGPRAFLGLERCVKSLTDDPDTRQAVVSLWNNNEHVTNVKDVPCTLTWGFRIRNDALNMTTTMRSNDVFTGVTYDIPAMTRIQSAMAWALGVEVGEYVHHAHSLHLYERDLDAIERMRTGSDGNE